MEGELGLLVSALAKKEAGIQDLCASIIKGGKTAFVPLTQQKSSHMSLQASITQLHAERIIIMRSKVGEAWRISRPCAWFRC